MKNAVRNVAICLCLTASCATPAFALFLFIVWIADQSVFQMFSENVKYWGFGVSLLIPGALIAFMNDL